MCRSKHVEHSINFGIINYITKLYLVGISTETFVTCPFGRYDGCIRLLRIAGHAIIRSLINPEDGGTTMLRNIVNCPSIDAAQRHIAEDNVS
jgi:hypothetical protein